MQDFWWIIGIFCQSVDRKLNRVFLGGFEPVEQSQVRMKDDLSPLPRPQVGCLWIGETLSFLEELCLSSMQRHGAEVTLFSYTKPSNIPDGIKFSDASDIVPWDPDLVHHKTRSPALMSDLFRYHLLKKKPGVIWCDTDILFLKPIDQTDRYIFGYETDTLVNGALAALPSNDPTLDLLLEYCESRFPIPPWVDTKTRAELAETPVHVSQLPWGTWGPAAFTWFLRQTGAIDHAKPCEVYHPVPFADVRDLIFRGRDTARWITARTQTVHLYGRATRRIVAERFDGIPPWHGFLGQQLRDYGIDPRSRPLQRAG